MRSPLSEAVVRCQARRLRRAVAAAPLPATLLTIAVMVAPIVFVRVGGALAGELAGAVATAGVADAVVLGPVLAAAVAGAAFASSLPGREAFGGQVAVAPFDGTAGIVAVMLVPLSALALVVAPSLMALSLGLGGALPGGYGAGLALAAAVLAAVPAGACVAEGAIGLVRRRYSRCVVVAAGALAWLGAGAVLGSAPLGPLAACGSALRGALPAPVALSAACSTGTALALAWVALAASRPARRDRRPRRALVLVRGRTVAIPAALASTQARRSDVRAGAALAVVFGVAGAAVAVVAAAPPPAAFLLGTTTALLGSVLWALSLGSLLAGGRWLWAGAPRGCSAVGTVCGPRLGRGNRRSRRARRPRGRPRVGSTVELGGCRRRRRRLRRRAGRDRRHARSVADERGRPADDVRGLCGDRRDGRSVRRSRRAAARLARRVPISSSSRSSARRASPLPRSSPAAAAREEAAVIAATRHDRPAPRRHGASTGRLSDAVRGDSWPLNRSGAFVLARSRRAGRDDRARARRDVRRSLPRPRGPTCFGSSGT